jgi:hypothetical protein
MTRIISLPHIAARIGGALAGAGARYCGNLFTGVRLSLPVPAGTRTLTATTGQLVALLTTLGILAALDDLLVAGIPATFSVWGLLSWAAMSYFWLATLAVIVVIDRDESASLRIAVAMAGVLVFQFIVWAVAGRISDSLQIAAFDNHYTAIWSGFLAWEILVFARILIRTVRVRIRAAAAYSALYGLAVYATLTLLPHSSLLLEPREPSGTAFPDIEATYYAQPNLLGQSLYELSPQRAGIVDLYFIGFAAYARQDVFQREIEQARVIFEQRFDAIGHAISLINNPRTLQTVPLANRHNLERAVAGVAERIDKSEDIVVLFLSSHGDDDATISVDLNGFGLNDLSASDIREIFDTHGIEWRVVIVSACYSGSFIEELASPRTLVLTAAAADRSSFGCAHENEWTYFGEALFAYALNRSTSLVEAFRLAAERIGKRETEEGKTASLPQISLGAEIADYLQANAL